MMDEVVTALTSNRGLFVIASSSTLAFKGRSVSAHDVGRQLGVRYLLEGSVRKSGDRVRIAAKLVDAGDGAQLWAERFDDTLADVFALQDRVALTVAGLIGSTIATVELATGGRTADRKPWRLRSLSSRQAAAQGVPANGGDAGARTLRACSRTRPQLCDGAGQRGDLPPQHRGLSLVRRRRGPSKRGQRARPAGADLRPGRRRRARADGRGALIREPRKRPRARKARHHARSGRRQRLVHERDASR